MPCAVFAHRIGATSRQETATVTPVLLSHNSSRIIKDATGVVLITVSAGLKNARRGFENAVITPIAVPAIMPSRHPADILIRVKAQLLRKAGVTASSKRRLITVSGGGKRKALPTIAAVSCQSRSHIAMTPALIKVFLILSGIVYAFIGN